MRPKNGIIVKAISDDSSVCFSNDVGGTVFMPKGTYRVRVVKSWHDYETGDVIHGELLNKKDIATARKLGTTGYTPKDYEQYKSVDGTLPERIQEARKAFLNPPIIFFREWSHPKIDSSLIVE